MRILNIQDTLLKIDLVQRLSEAMLSQARITQSEGEPKALEYTRIRQETLDQPQDTRETGIREEEKKRREPFLGRRNRRQEKEQPPKHPDDGHIIDITA
ncbi:MAG TPA: hypothetical protein ENN09_00515 [Planctomycetes bacterium]|nr:hypothetical protein [Planctomycetota bacterium]